MQQQSSTVGVNVSGNVDGVTIGGNASATNTIGANSSLSSGVTATAPANTVQGNLMFKVTVMTTVTTTNTNTYYNTYGVPCTTSTTNSYSTTSTYYSDSNKSSKVVVVKAGK